MQTATLPKCPLCKGANTIDLPTTPMSVIEVDGQWWQLRFGDSGPTWVLSDSKGTKDAGYIDVGDLGRPPTAAAQNRCLNLVRMKFPSQG